MSCKLNIRDITDESMNKVNTELKIKLEDNKYSSGPPRYIYPYETINDDLYVPFAYGHRQLHIPRPTRDNFSAMKAKFEGSLRPHQEEIKKEAVNYLNKKGSVMISAFTGFGKCLKMNTPILMYDGSIKLVQNVKEGDLLMGDDSTPRKVLSTCVGEEQMYDIVPKRGSETFGCNESHILSLKFSDHKAISWNTKQNTFSVQWFDKENYCISTRRFDNREVAEEFRNNIQGDDIVDITMKDYLSLPDITRQRLKLYRVPIEFSSDKLNPSKDLDFNPYLFGLWLSNSSKNIGNKPTRLADFLNNYNLTEHKRIPRDFKVSSRRNRLELLAGIIEGSYNKCKNSYKIIQYNKRLVSDITFLARSLGFTVDVKETDSKQVYSTITIHGEGMEEIPLRSYTKQVNCVKDSLQSDFTVVPINDTTYYGFVIDGNHRFVLGDFTVTHNTCCAINLACAVGFKTLIIVNKIVLMKQWEESILKFSPEAKVQKLTPKSAINDSDFYIMNAINVPKMNRGFFSDIGMLIIDEAHMIMAETLSRSMQYIHPRYLIGLTATPYRPDGLDILLELYFGKYKIVRKLKKKHVAYVVNTGFTPTVEKNAQGRTKWDVILDSQAKDERRNELIIELLRLYRERTFLVLVKRVSQGDYIVKRLKEEGESVTSLLGKNQEFDVDARILVGTLQKVSCGFDHPKLNALMLAADLEEYFIQTLGRCMRTEEVEPIIFDLVDENPILKKHFNTRRGVYIEHGGQVRTFDMSVLDS